MEAMTIRRCRTDRLGSGDQPRGRTEPIGDGRCGVPFLNSEEDNHETGLRMQMGSQ
jgi:hypothetical protein